MANGRMSGLRTRGKMACVVITSVLLSSKTGNRDTLSKHLCCAFNTQGKLTEDATQGIAHIPGCVNMTYQECKLLAESIKDKHPEWFPANCRIKHKKRQIASDHDLWYWNLALPCKLVNGGCNERKNCRSCWRL